MKKIGILLFTASSLLANISPDGFESFKNNYFVETGTYYGQGIRFAVRAGFREIHSVEIDHNLVLHAQKTFTNNPNIHIWEGDSGTMLWQVIKDIHAPITFWLDGHNGTPNPDSTQKNTPLIEELEQIKRHPIKTHTILIDDMHCCGTVLFDFLTRDDIMHKILEINPAYTITFVDGGDAGEYKNNIMVARVNDINVPTRVDLHEKIFTAIYDNATWGRNSEGVGFSGGGSVLSNARPYVSLLTQFMKTHTITSVVDAGCGDWEFSRYIDWSGINYIGYDIVKHVIEKNKMRFGSPHIQFVHANFLTEDLPAADLLLCKEVLQHLPNEDILQFLQQIKKFKYCLITNEVYPRTLSSDNIDIEIGGGHKVDLSCHPFNIQGTKVLNYNIEGGIHQVFLIDNTIE